MSRCFGAIEAGGTKFVCAVGRAPRELLAETSFPTTTPEETFARAGEFLHNASEPHGGLAAIGIASFGPVDLVEDSPTYGWVTSTPKPGWRDTEFAGVFARRFGVPVGFDTDVNGAALAEWRWGAGEGRSNLLYVTVGTGIGGGFVMGGQTLRARFHPEMGHVGVRKHPEDTFSGCCPFHGDACLEGLASGRALELRSGEAASAWTAEHPGWTLEVDYLAQAVANWVLTLAPEAVVLGGGVMQQTHLYSRIRQRVRALLGGYLSVPEMGDLDERYLRPPALGSRSGVLGALALAMDAAR